MRDDRRAMRKLSRMQLGGLFVAALVITTVFVTVRPGRERQELNGAGRLSFAVPANIPSDCSADVTERLNTWLETVPDGATIAFAKDGCYQLDRTFNIANRNNLTFEGNDAVLQRKTPTPPGLLKYLPSSAPSPNPDRIHNRHVFVLSSKKITIRNLAVRGLNTNSDIDPTKPLAKIVFEPKKFGSGYGLPPHAPYTSIGMEGECGFMIMGSSEVTLSGVRIDGTFGDGISLGADNAPVSKDIVLKNIEIDRNGRQGVALISIENALLDNIRVLHSRGTGFDLEPNGAGSLVKGVEIRNSYVNAYAVPFAVTGSEVARVANDNIDIHDNTVRSTRPNVPWFYGGRFVDEYKTTRFNWRIADNTVLGPSEGIGIQGVTDVTIVGNRQLAAKVAGGGPPNPGVALYNVSGRVIIRNNTFIGAYETYIVTSSTPQITACNNKLIDTGRFDQPTVCP
jgi:hypothetical protein